MAFFMLGDDDDQAESLRQMFSPNMVDKQIRQAIQYCWMGMPKEKRHVEEVERQIRHLVDRALRDLREDFDAFFGSKDN